MGNKSNKELELGGNNERMEAADFIHNDDGNYNEKVSLSYWDLFADNPNYRWFIASYIITHCGSWLTYIASLTLLRESGYDEQIYISLLVVIRLIPNTLFSFPGGILADSRDRKINMLQLDILGSIIALFYLFCAKRSIIWLYVCAFTHESIQGFYEPNRSAIIPQLVRSTDYIEKANEIITLSWSFTTAIAASLGGLFVNYFGISMCFIIDSAFFLLSAIILSNYVKGDFDVHQHNEKKIIIVSDNDIDVSGSDRLRPSTSSIRMLEELWTFLRSCEVGAYVFLKAGCALMFGAADVLNVAFSESNEGVLNSVRVGWMFAAVGVGCLIGPLLMPEGRPYIIACIFGFIELSAGYGLMGWCNEFWQKCMWTILRSAGTTIVWIDSTILIQKATPSTLLGRVSGLDYGLALLGEASSALFAGVLQDNGYSADQIAFILSGCSLFIAFIWTIWYFKHRKRIHYNQILS